MRVVAGEYGGRRLKSLSGDNTRPTTDKVKGAIFNMIGPYFDGGVVLDLFSGSGSLGIESISRGMDHAYCIDRHFGAIKVIQENVAMTKEPEKFTVWKMPADVALAKFRESGQTFDLVLLDPPYAQQQLITQLTTMSESGLFAENCRVVCETDRAVDLPETVATLVKTREQTYGLSKITIYRNEA